MRRSKWIAVAAMAASVAMVTAACGSSNGASNTTESSQSSSSETSSETSSSEAPAETSESSSSEAPSSGSTGEAFKFGYVFPETGDLAFLGPPQIQAAKYAIKLINEAGGVNGQPVPDIVGGDEAGDAALASQAATAEINAGVNAILGAAATGMTMAIIDKVVSAGIAECSGSNTGVVLTDYPGKKNGDTQLYYRTAPSDALQGPVLGNMVLEDGWSNVAVVARGDDYGKGLAQATADAITAGGGTVVLNDVYDPKTTDFSGLVEKIKAANPDAVVTVSFEEGFQLWKQLFAAGLTPDKVGIYGADGMHSADAPAKNFPDPKIVDGAGGTAPASADNPDFVAAMKAFAPDLKETQFASQVYDCANIFALAAEQAKSNKAMDWAQYVNGITKDGTECNNFADCKKLIDDGTDIHYVGAAGDLSFTDAGEPGKATIEVWRYENGGKLKSLGTKESSIS
jgi:branched-chain amino acid transport system substrate-binding protein